MSNLWGVVARVVTSLTIVVILAWCQLHLLPILRQWVDWRTKLPQLPEPAPQLPIDLQLLASGYDTEWAQDDARKAMLEMYAQTRSWEQVRAHFQMGR